MARTRYSHPRDTDTPAEQSSPRDDLARALNVVMSDRVEGGYVNDPNDPGGETKYGISKRAYPDEDIANLTPERAAELYRADYWNAARCNEMPWPVNLVVFDGAVNQGVFGVSRCLQEALKVTVDGKIGPVTLAAVAKRDPLELAVRVAARRALRYTTDSNFYRYGEGWLARLAWVVSEFRT